jgi:hypothetical protein
VAGRVSDAAALTAEPEAALTVATQAVALSVTQQPLCDGHTSWLSQDRLACDFSRFTA